jgi:4-hydroxybenzoate polyprenyltransferase
MASKLKTYCQLVRLPNVFTAMADPLAGVLLVAGAQVSEMPRWELAAVMLVSACLYAGGVAFNDYFDREDDREQRPERPLPSGRITPRQALWSGVSLYAVGLALAAAITFIPILRALARIEGETMAVVIQGFIARPTFGLAVALAGLALAYNFALKLFPVARELGMGFCRALNLMLGLTLGFEVASASPSMWLPVVILLGYVTALTAISRFETRVPFTRRVVKYLVLGIVVLDALFVAAFQGPSLAAWVLTLLLPALVLGKFLPMA